MTATTRAKPAAPVAAGLGTILGVWAHPDDEAYLSAGLMAAAVAAGARVVCVTVTAGERGTDDPTVWPPSRLGPHRAAELAASMRILGVAEHRCLGYADGGCAGVATDEAVAALAAVVVAVRPDSVLTFGPDGMTGHSDHRTVSAWVDAALARSQLSGVGLLHATKTHRWCDRFADLHRRLAAFPPGLPPQADAAQTVVEVELTDDLLEAKLAALRAHASQVLPVIERVGETVFRAWIANECFRVVGRPADSGH